MDRTDPQSTLAPPVEGVDQLLESLRQPRGSLVALSGGVDSAVVAALLEEAIGTNAWAVTLTGPAVSAAEVERAATVARHIGIRHELVEIDPLRSPEYRSNPSNRCYFCRQVETSALRTWGAAHGIARYYDGVHRDDLSEDRPGVRAMEEAGFEHPLARAGWGKLDVRRYARSIGLPNADQPSEACLASRVRHGQPISAELLGRIAEAEAGLHRRGFLRVRVRVEGTGARVEVDPSETGRLLAEPTSTEVRAELTKIGFDPVSLDPAGYRWRPSA